MARREGTFCDIQVRALKEVGWVDEPCPGVAIGKCIGCGKDICAKHGSDTALRCSVQRQPENTSSHVEVLSGDIAMCWPCSKRMEQLKTTLAENLIPILCDALRDGVAVALASEAMKQTR